jgi:hypothetical protein
MRQAQKGFDILITILSTETQIGQKIMDLIVGRQMLLS